MPELIDFLRCPIVPGMSGGYLVLSPRLRERFVRLGVVCVKTPTVRRHSTVAESPEAEVFGAAVLFCKGLLPKRLLVKTTQTFFVVVLNDNVPNLF